MPIPPRTTMPDPTYDRAAIDANPIWHLAFVMSEIDNDAAPIGWWRYRNLAESLSHHFDITPKAK